MSNTDNLAEKKPIEQEEPQREPSTAKPFHRQFFSKFIALLLTLIVALALISILFYQQSEQSRLVVEGELTPLKQQLEQLQALQKAEYLVNELLLNDNGDNFVELQTELLAVNRQLLRQESSNAHLYQQWLNANKSASDIVLRIQESSGRNEQLKQSSIIQLQLMWFSVTPLIDKKIAQQEILFKQLQADHIKDKLTLNRANAYVRAIRQSDNLQQLKSLLAKTLTSFEQLTIHTSMDDFNLLRVDVEQIISQGKVLKKNNETKAMLDFIQQIATFEEIAVTQQRALAKWQGYIRLEQSYQLDLKMQKIQLTEILKAPEEKKSVYVPSLINDLLVKFNINITQQVLSMILVLAISLSLLVFCSLLWRLREQIKVTAQESVRLIHQSIHNESSTDVKANCAETQEIISQMQSIAKPAHNEQEFQQLLQQCQDHQQVIDEQAQALNTLALSTNQQQSDISEQAAAHLKGELQRYKLLEDEVLSFIQQQQAKYLNKSTFNEKDKVVQSFTLIPVYEQLRQFYLASNIRSEKTVQTLTDVNLIDEIHAVLMSKHTELESFNNQLYFSYDEQLLLNVKLDFHLYEQLINLLLDITLSGCHNAQLHFNLQLQDKSAGQQLVSFVVKVKTKMDLVLPDLITQLIDSHAPGSQKCPLVDIFNIIFAKQHGENITAQLIDGGFQLSFELPLAIASSTALKETQENKLTSIQVMLLSSNEMLKELLEQFILAASGKLEALTRIDSFEQQFTAKNLSKHELDVLIIDGYFAQTHLALITQQLNNLPKSLQPKLMLLQSTEFSCDGFGFYSQTDHLLFKDMFIQDVEELFASDASTNQLLSPEQCQQGCYSDGGLPVLLAVNSPQKHQKFQRLLRCLGLQVQVVSHATAQQELWESGLYCILFTEFLETSLVKIASKPLMDIAVFSLTDDVPKAESNTYFDDWHIAKLTEDSTLEKLSDVLAPWLNVESKTAAIVSPEGLLEGIDECDDEESAELVITELVTSLAKDNNNAAFDFSQYLHHQGSVELALFMLDDYTTENHQQLDVLIHAIKAKELTKAKEAIITLQLNAQILSSAELDKLCSQWSLLLNGNDKPSSLKEMNILLKETRAALTAIDSYAESI